VDGTVLPFYWWGHEMDASKCTYGAEKTTVADPAHANAWGLMEMLGNVYEWCDTWYCEDSEGASEYQQGTSRVVRGGWFFSYNPEFLRSADRYYYAPGYRLDDYGFRFSRTP
jgi:formylglycine-generating enzyme required for sulfatase activity